MRRVLPSTPFDLIYLFFYLERLQIIEFGLVRLELCVEFVLAGFFLWSSIKHRTREAKVGVKETYRLIPFE